MTTRCHADTPVDQRLRANLVVSEGGCHEWSGARSSYGYGSMWVNGRSVAAHRIAWQVANNATIPDGLIVLHSCDNPPCCNPAHLRLGTHWDNKQDSIRRGRVRYLRGEAHVSAKLSDADVVSAIEMYAEGTRIYLIAQRFGIVRSSVQNIVNNGGSARAISAVMASGRSDLLERARDRWERQSRELEAFKADKTSPRVPRTVLVTERMASALDRGETVTITGATLVEVS